MLYSYLTCSFISVICILLHMLSLHTISLSCVFTCFDIYCFCMIKGLQNKFHYQLKSNSNTNEG